MDRRDFLKLSGTAVAAGALAARNAASLEAQGDREAWTPSRTIA
jgi:hypothetical protein